MQSRHAPLVRYLLAFGAGSVAGQMVLASAVVQRTVVVPFSRWQGTLVESFLLGGPLTVNVDPTCSGLDVIAMCVAATLAYPVALRRRVSGAAVGVALLLLLNLVRIASLAGASQSPSFQMLHEDVWPMLLIAGAAAWILLWIRTTETATRTLSPATRRFLAWSAVMLGVYVLAVPALTEAGVLVRAARGAAQVTATTLSTFGADASVSEQLLRVGRAHYLVTPDCITTPLIAFYVAALFAFPVGWPIRLAGLAASVPLFSALALVRLLTVALPMVVDDSSLVVTHGFNQILAGAVMLVAAALWWRGAQPPARAAVFGLCVAAGATVVSAATGPALATAWSSLLSVSHLAVPPGLVSGAGNGDGQGALLMLPVFQLALFGATWVIARRHAVHARWAVAAAVLLVSQWIFLALLGWMDVERIRPLPAMVIRGWALAVPVLLILAASGSHAARPAVMVNGARVTS